MTIQIASLLKEKAITASDSAVTLNLPSLRGRGFANLKKTDVVF